MHCYIFADCNVVDHICQCYKPGKNSNRAGWHFSTTWSFLYVQC